MTYDYWKNEIEFIAEFGKRSGKYAAITEIGEDIRYLFREGLDDGLDHLQIFDQIFRHLAKKQHDYFEDYINFKKD